MMHGVEEGPINVPFHLTFSRGALLALAMLASFLYFQFLSIDNQFFLFFEFSSFVFLFFGGILLLRANSEAHIHRPKIFVNIVALICISLVLIAAYSLATSPRGGVMQSHYWQPKDFSVVASRRSGPGTYVGSNYPYEFIYSGNYAVGFVVAFASWGGTGGPLIITADETLNLNGTLYAALMFTAQPGVFYETRNAPVAFVNSSSSYADIGPLDFWGWGNRDRVRVEGYKIELWVQLWLDGEDAGSALNFTFHPASGIEVHDFTVDSTVQNTAAILLSGAFATIYALVPLNALKPSFERRVMPRLNRLILGIYKGQPTRKSFLKECIKCGKDIPIASEQCPHCGAEQK
jgi:hypothetical protein